MEIIKALGIHEYLTQREVDKLIEEQQGLNDDRNKSFEHITDEVESFIYKKGIIDGYEIETSSEIDFDYNKATDRLTITINMSRDI